MYSLAKDGLEQMRTAEGKIVTFRIAANQVIDLPDGASLSFDDWRRWTKLQFTAGAVLEPRSGRPWARSPGATPGGFGTFFREFVTERVTFQRCPAFIRQGLCNECWRATGQGVEVTRVLA